MPWTGLESVARAYAKLVDEVNKIDLKGSRRDRVNRAPTS